METFTIVLDWIGAFFLSVEAMKLKNFTLIMKKLRIALNPPYYHKEDGSTLIPTPAPEYSGIRKFSFFIQVAFGYFFILLIIGLTKQKDFVFHHLTNFYGSLLHDKLILILGKVGLGFVLFFALPFSIGLLMTRIFSNLSDNYENILERLEKFTVTGILGLIGFILLSISFTIKLLL